MTTVGYGDKYPVTGAGRGVAVVLLVGIGLIGVVTATVASFFVQQTADECGFRAIPYTRSDRIRTPIPTFSYTR